MPAEDLPPEYSQVPDPLFFSINLNFIIDHLRQGEAIEKRGSATRLFQVLLQELYDQSRKPETGTPRPYEAAIRRQVASIREQPGSVPKIRDLAKAMALSPDHYSRIFKKTVGQSPRELVQEARLERACQLLRETPLGITEIAEQVGYADVFQFSRIFKRRRGVAPSRWR